MCVIDLSVLIFTYSLCLLTYSHLHIVLQNENKQVHETWLLGCHPEISTGALPLKICRGTFVMQTSYHLLLTSFLTSFQVLLAL